MNPHPDVVVIGAGLVGAACAYHLERAGARVLVVDRTGPAGGTTAGGEGNILLSDKLPGPEAALVLHSITLWHEMAAHAQSSGGDPFEFDEKGGVVAARAGQLAPLLELAGRQRAAGITTEVLDTDGIRELEPRISAEIAGGVWYPQDCQVQPMLAARWLLAEAVRLGAKTEYGAEVIAAQRASGAEGARLTGVRTSQGVRPAGAVVNAAGPWCGEVARRLGGWLPVRPRRGHILVTEPLPPLVRHKVYEADYVGTVVSDEASVRCSAVVEGTRAGPVLIGSSREFAGWDRQPALGTLAEMARRATALFPFLSGVRAMRCYVGFRPASPDHLPLIGPDASVSGLFHASGHEGAGIGLAPATGHLIAALITGTAPAVGPAPFTPARLVKEAAA